jgi:hypothetical protein
MKIDRQSVHIDTLGLVDKKVLVQPCLDDKGKGKKLSLVTSRDRCITWGGYSEGSGNKKG